MRYDKNIIYSAALAIGLLGILPAMAQQRFTALYDYSERNAVTGEVSTDLIRLSQEAGYFSCLSENTYRKDQVQDSLAREGLDPYTVVAMTRDMARGMRTTIVTDAGLTKRVVYEFPYTFIHYEEQIPQVDWESRGSQQTKEVAGIPSKEVVGKLYGREWRVSYAPEIPFAVGPWKLTGLPGLITEAVTTDSLYHFRLVAFEPTPDKDLPVSSVRSGKVESKLMSKKEVLDGLYQSATNNRAWLKKLYPVSSQPAETPEELRRNALARKSYQYIEIEP